MSDTVDGEPQSRREADDVIDQEKAVVMGEPVNRDDLGRSQTPDDHSHKSAGGGGGVLSKALSRVRTPDGLDPGPPPDGGLRAWSVALAAHLVLFNTWGFVNSFGLFQTYYVEVMRIGGPSSVAWIGTTQVFILFGMGTFTGRGLDAGFFRLQFVSGCVIHVSGMFLLSLCREYWQIFLAQALFVGFGYGLVFVPTLALVSTYFLRRRSTALAISVTGSATGGLVFPAIAERMLPRAGFAWTVRTMGFVQLALALVALIFLKPRLPPRKSGPLVEWSAFREAPYALYCLGSFLYFWSVYVGFFFIGSFGRNVLGTTQSTSINLLLTINGVGIPGRLIPAYIAQQWTGPLNFMIPTAVATGIILYCWAAADSVTGLWVFAITYGMAAACLQALYPVVLTSLTKDPKKAGVRAGMGFSVIAFAVLTGPSIAGALVQRDAGGFLGLQIFSATCMVASGAVLFCVRLVSVGWKWEKI